MEKTDAGRDWGQEEKGTTEDEDGRESGWTPGVGDAIQPSHPLSSPSPILNLSQHQSFPMSQFFTSGGQSIGALASALPMNIQG